jgi:hypothetical protein
MTYDEYIAQRTELEKQAAQALSDNQEARAYRERLEVEGGSPGLKATVDEVIKVTDQEYKDSVAGQQALDKQNPEHVARLEEAQSQSPLNDYLKYEYGYEVPQLPDAKTTVDMAAGMFDVATIASQVLNPLSAADTLNIQQAMLQDAERPAEVRNVSGHETSFDKVIQNAVDDLESNVGRMGTANDMRRDADIQSGQETMAAANQVYANAPALSLGSGGGGEIGPIQGSATFGPPSADATLELKEAPPVPSQETMIYAVKANDNSMQP